MSSSTLKALCHAIRRPLVWLLVLAIVVHGHTAVVVHVLGSNHRHELTSSPGLGEQVRAVFRDIRAWRGELRARLLGPDGSVHAHGERHRHPSGDNHHAHATSGTDDGRSPAIATRHGGFQRHHHDPLDPSVVTLDGAGGDDAIDAAASGTTASASAAVPPLAHEPQSPLAAPRASACAWPAPSADHWADAAQRLPERPPRT